MDKYQDKILENLKLGRNRCAWMSGTFIVLACFALVVTGTVLKETELEHGGKTAAGVCTGFGVGFGTIAGMYHLVLRDKRAQWKQQQKQKL